MTQPEAMSAGASVVREWAHSDQNEIAETT
jgi:hypothetical protein